MGAAPTAPLTEESCASGELPAQRYAWGTRTMWMVDENTLQATVAAATTISVQGFADELGLTYHQVHMLCRNAGLLRPDRPRGTPIAFDDHDADLVRDLVRRRQAG